MTRTGGGLAFRFRRGLPVGGGLFDLGGIGLDADDLLLAVLGHGFPPEELKLAIGGTSLATGQRAGRPASFSARPASSSKNQMWSPRLVSQMPCPASGRARCDGVAHVSDDGELQLIVDELLRDCTRTDPIFQVEEHRIEPCDRDRDDADILAPGPADQVGRVLAGRDERSVGVEILHPQLAVFFDAHQVTVCQVVAAVGIVAVSVDESQRTTSASRSDSGRVGGTSSGTARACSARE